MNRLNVVLRRLRRIYAAGVHPSDRTGASQLSGQAPPAHQNNHSKREKLTKKKLDTFSGVYWLLATAMYLAWSFKTMEWDQTWVLWPVAGVLFAAVCGIARMILGIRDRA